MVVFTVGHSTRSAEAFLRLLAAHEVRRLVDIRRFPGSRRNPQFNADALCETLRGAGLDYVALRELGGRRPARKDSPNMGWRNAGFRGYADYMQTEAFEHGLARLLRLAAESPTAIMCAESVPWRCHRSLVADALMVRGVEVEHIMSENRCQAHRLTAFAQVEGARLSYPDTGVPLQARLKLE